VKRIKKLRIIRIRKRKRMKKIVLVVLLGLSGSAFGLDMVPVSEIKAKLCSEDVWMQRQESIFNSCWNGAGTIRPVAGHMVVFGFLMNGADICYLPCDFGYFYRNGGN
jgi:hypothetical protein